MIDWSLVSVGPGEGERTRITETFFRERTPASGNATRSG